MTRTTYMFGLGCGLVATVACGGSARMPVASTPARFNVVEASFPDMLAALESGRLTSRQLRALYLERIATHEDRLNATITVNPRALEEAEAMDKERAAGRVRRPLDGIPIALKDNIDTTDIRTTGPGGRLAPLLLEVDTVDGCGSEVAADAW